ncbi:peroxiredoxin Q/BCP [Leifsonia sp. 98AMF]|uniref:thioredoxin-dependent thiol peroxidase n=1 Tax=unclassified Leifsonia TaxID=2663824 RepID=UPI00087D4DFD|nr:MULTISPECIES: thioredoxin-dependent thiol peroxidase [unclassified Leifsonia]SDH19954.1 peroxiredoxin Q/BCP [Leifsonia sp. 197AMF]SDJ18747.1 peroxiredoxin Q/BCP [Leifsonia sp. 466MF]SDJ47830.1 peroxiredoxin Q/BCP [Leifsonia sp. 157MF]SDN40041.1 peroxiredoxin Q/BCP [Leifsonia sp. 509MF]SEM80724.1 peroxiredoxin Q/BCP [Leifsonia sp. 467MF]
MTDARLEAGTPAPAFTLTDQDGTTVSLSDFAGENVIVYFYPAAMTPGCTTEACDFRDNLNSLKSAGYQVIGISKDVPARNKEFQEQEGLNFPLLSDEDLAVHRTYGAYGEKKLYGKTVEGVIRSTFVVDPDGTLRLPLYNVKATGHVASLRKKLGIDA